MLMSDIWHLICRTWQVVKLLLTEVHVREKSEHLKHIENSGPVNFDQIDQFPIGKVKAY